MAGADDIEGTVPEVVEDEKREATVEQILSERPAQLDLLRIILDHIVHEVPGTPSPEGAWLANTADSARADYSPATLVALHQKVIETPEDPAVTAAAEACAAQILDRYRAETRPPTGPTGLNGYL